MASRRLRRTLFIVGVLAFTAGAALLYLFNADLTWTRGPLARVASRAFGRELSLSGAYHLHLGSITHLVADDVVLANPPWARDPALVSIDHLDLALEARSLLRGPVHLLHLKARGIEIHLERDGHGNASWELGRRAGSPRVKAPATPPRVDRLELHGLRAGFESPTRTSPLDLVLAALQATERASGVVEIDLNGAVNGRDLRLAGHLGPIGTLVAGEPFDQDLSFTLGTVEGTLKGRATSLSTLAGSSLDLSLHGPDLAGLMVLLGISGAPGGPFRLEAATRPAGAAIDARLEATTRLLRAKAIGRITPASPPALDLQVTASGKDLEALAAMAGVHGLPAEPFTLETRMHCRGFPITLEGLKMRTGKTLLSVRGTVGQPPALDGTGLSIEIETPDASLIGRLAGVELPAGKLVATGRVAVEGSTIRITGVDARLGANELRADGSLGRGAGKPGASFEIDVGGPELSVFDDLAGTRLPPGPFRAAGKVSSLPGGIRLESLAVELGGNRIEATGIVRTTRDRAGSELELSLRGRDPTFLASLAGIRGLPAETYRGAGHLVVGPHFLEIRRIELHVGRNQVTGNVRLTRPPSVGPIELELTLRGENLGELAPLLGLRSLPPHPYEASGKLEITPKDYGFSAVAIRCGGIEASAGGRLGRPPGFDGTKLEIHATGPRLSELGPALALPALPELPFDITGALRIGPKAIAFETVRGTLGTSRIEVDGAFRPRGLPIRLALDLSVRGGDPADTTRFLQGIGLGTMPSLPARRYSVAGRFERDPTGFHFGRMQLKLGKITARIDGFLGAPPGFRGTRLDLEAAGGNRKNIEVLLGKRLDVEGLRFHCSLHRLEPKTAEGGAILRIEGKLSANRLRLGAPEERGKSTTSPPRQTPSSNDPGKAAGGYVFSEKPFRLTIPKIFEGAIDCHFGDLLLGTADLLDARVALLLEDGGLQLDSLRAGLRGGGSLSGSLALAPADRGLAVSLRLRLHHQAPSLLLGEASRKNEPHLDFRLELDGNGTSLHDLLSRTRGRFHLRLGRGAIQSSILDSLGDSFFLSLFDALNPFRTRERMTELECGAAAGVIEDGTVRLDPMGIKTDKVTTLAKGTINLGTEKLNIDFASKPRRGIGLSASMLTNSYIKIGGTLRKPSVQLKPLTAAAKTGLAVATAGISLLAEGLWNRVTSEEDICAQMDAKIDTIWKGPQRVAPKAGQHP